MRYLWLCFVFFVAVQLNVLAASGSLKKLNTTTFNYSCLQDTTKRKALGEEDSLRQDSLSRIKIKTIYNKLSSNTEKETENLSMFPAISLQQYLKGNYAGLYIQEPSGEPGSMQNMFIRGTAMPLLNKKDLYAAQPLVVLDGIPLIMEHPFAYDIQQYDFNRIGPATNLLAGIDMNNIASVEVLKDLAGTVAYGPRGVNGVIVLTSKSPDNVRRISFNSYIGMVQKPTVNTINGKYENEFRQRFYDIYTTNGRYSDDEEYPVYLSDSLNNVYSGKSNWTDLYYKNALIYGINLGLSGGTDRANFRFSLGNTKSEGVADQTGLDRYSAMFNINMRPVQWLLFSAMINANRINRDRNRSLRDRFAQLNYFPDLSAPLAPNKDYYASYLSEYDKGFDDNKTNAIQGYARLVGTFGKLKLSSAFNVDYNEGYRDIFYAKGLLQGNSYASNYYGFNQRLMMDNKASYNYKINEDHDFNFTLGQSMIWDMYKYNNAYAYKGANDYIKINLLDSEPIRNGQPNPDYLTPKAFPRELTYRFLDKTEDNLLTFSGKVDYAFQNKYFLSATLRLDGSSNAQPTSRWFYSPVLSAAWNIKNEFLRDNKSIDDVILRASVGRMGRTHVYDNYAQGPQYTASVGYTGNLTVPGYNAFGVLTRSYAFGWVGYGVPWAYTDQVNVGADVSMLKNRLRLSLDVYSKTDKNQLIAIPSYAEYGYKQAIESGLSVNNTGVDLTVSALVINRNKFSWNSALNFNHNQNQLKALPRGLDQIVIGNRLLKVGEAVDQYWLLENEGIYTADSQIPVVNGQPLKYNGTVLKAGDPRWKDQNGDNVIDEKDKVLKGNMMPGLSGGFDNGFKYGNWSLNTSLYFNLGRKLINQEMANRFDFVNREGNSEVNSVKEITFWEKRGDYSKYPLYNPWSTVIPYRVDQDLFLENASFLKLRSVAVGYELGNLLKRKNIKINKFFVYGSVNNVFTVTPYTGQDPELVGYDGLDTGYGQPIPRTYTLGVKMEL
ncbi:SusC/RagA family TonB-linked outer membrane protein [Pedobacter rhizosphaerae]|uniref:TonB-linked outer membrane protein, SusC/RagA family n=1 Tax=Pedobacter rhizosphaerae TaxID=390241 RepID=A0A1H9UFI6_9SPHI|nr:SusC/RagA family TonB-linked outer membrane protein [Pedobacter rhizosphaerae]SES08216.1 TonB-linked outer membrane protein, SusC/RagA family [Pedobacter rhizosphaerae]